MAYTHTTYQSAVDQVSRMLGDSTKTFWTNAELLLNLHEALRTFGILTQYWVGRASFTIPANTDYIDLFTNANTASLLGYTLTAADIVTDMEYATIEPPTPAAWSGTEMYTLQDFTEAVQRSRNQFLFDTGSVLTQGSLAVFADPTGRESLPESVIMIRRAVWRSGEGIYSVLNRSDEYSAAGLSSGWQQDATDTPTAYSIMNVTPSEIQLLPPASTDGTVLYDYVAIPADIAANNSTLLNIPDSYGWIVKWLALASLLTKTGPGYDPPRATYALTRYAQAIEVIKRTGWLRYAFMDQIPLRIIGLQELDKTVPSWQSHTGTPTIVGTLMNLIALSPLTDETHTLTLDVVQNAPVSTNLAAFVQVSQDLLEPILRYTRHLALFKIGGAEFESSIPDASQFYTEALSRVGIVNAASPMLGYGSMLGFHDDFLSPFRIKN